MATSKKKTKRAGASNGSSKNAAAKQKQRRDPGILSEFRKELWGGVCVLLALLILLSGLDKESVLARFFMGMVGHVGLVILPLSLILCAIALFFHGGKPVTMRILCSLGFALLVSALAHLVIGESKAVWGGEMLGVLYREGADNLSGGLLGGLVAMLFCLPGGNAVGWAVCILLLIVTLPASLNLTLTGLLRALNDHRDELHRKDRPQRKEPAEVLVERAIQHREIRDERRQERQLRRQERNRFDYDLPVDDPDQIRKNAAEKKEQAVPVQLPLEPVTPRPAQKPRRIDIDLPVDDPILVSSQKPAAEQSVQPDPEPIFPPKPAASEPIPADEPVKAPPSEKVKASEARKAAAEVGMEIEQAQAQTQEQEKPAYVYPPIDLLNTVAHDSVDASAEMRENTRPPPQAGNSDPT